MIISFLLLLLITALYIRSNSKLGLIIGIDFLLCFIFNLYLVVSRDIDHIGNSYFTIILFKDFLICCVIYCYCRSFRACLAIFVYGLSQAINILSFIEYYTDSSAIYNVYVNLTRCIEIMQVIILLEWENVVTKCRHYFDKSRDYLSNNYCYIIDQND